jgi:hypothetical protein
MRQLPNVREAAGIAEWPDNARFGQAASIRAAQTALNGLQSVLAKAGYGFESYHRHHRKCDFTKEIR